GSKRSKQLNRAVAKPMPLAVDRDLWPMRNCLSGSQTSRRVKLPRLAIRMATNFMSSDRAFLKSKHRS
ncbi:MAG: hypothetical protein E6833_37120, partial [Bradyrhizobium sp.]|nr:hypothetical protein [Bradyrhizobium sp.]